MLSEGHSSTPATWESVYHVMQSHANTIFAQDYTIGTVSGKYVDRATEEEIIALINM